LELDQVEENRPLDPQQQVLLVFLKLRMEPVHHPLAGRLGAELPLQDGLDRIEPPGHLILQLPDRVHQPRRRLG